MHSCLVMYLLVSIVVITNLIYKSFYHLYILLCTNFGKVYLKGSLYGAKVEQMHKTQNSITAKRNTFFSID